MKTERESTQEFAIKDILINNCGKTLTPGNIDDIAEQMIWEMRKGPCAWAFSQGEPVAMVVSAHGDPEAFGEREIEVLADLGSIPYGTTLYRCKP